MQPAITTAIKEVLKTLELPEVGFVVDYPTDKNAEADVFSNVALVLSKQVGRAPREIALQIAAELTSKIDLVTNIEVAGPGFLNFILDREYFKTTLEQSLAAGDKWGSNDSWFGKKVLVEYTDPNPFKEFHIGHLFTNAVGESIARLFMMNGANTKRINYQGDVGLHVASALYGMQELGLKASSDFTAKDLGKAYALGATQYKENESAIAAIRNLNKKVYSREDVDVNALYDAGRSVSLDYFESIYEMVGTKFDDYFFESEAGPKGKEIVETNPDIFPESDGAYIFDGESHGLHTRVFLNKEGLPTYEAKELALAKMKEDRLGKYDHSVISTSNEITEYFKVLKKAMSFVYPELEKKTEHIGHGTVRLTSGKMSSRTGDVITAVSFIEDVAVSAKQRIEENGHTADEKLATTIAIGAIKYATLKGSIMQDTVFDKETALSFEGASGPYLQYTYARIQSVLAKAVDAGVSANTEIASDQAYAAEKMIEQFPEVIEFALVERAPHTVVTYLTELASEFNSFYAAEKIADADDQYAPYKAAVATAVGQTLRQGLWALGIEAPEKM